MLDLFKEEYSGHRLHFQDETHLGLITKCGRKLTAKGVKPIGIKASDYRNYYIYGTVEPESGGFLMYEFDKINSENFQEFLNAFELAYPEPARQRCGWLSYSFCKEAGNTPTH
jgi:hypothetical protein